MRNSGRNRGPIRMLVVALAFAATIVLGTGDIHASHAKAKKGNHPICNLSTCKKTKIHKHKGKTYAQHHKNDGHSYHKNKLCKVSSCRKTKNHKHNGVTYTVHHEGDGHAYHGGSGSGKHSGGRHH